MLLLILACGVLRMADPIRWAGADGTALAYLTTPLVLLLLSTLPALLREMKSSKVGGDGVTLDALDEVRRTAAFAFEQARVAVNASALSRRVVTERLTSRPAESAHATESGRTALANGRVLTARLKRTDDADWFDVQLRVTATPNGAPLAGYVVFHLHDTFADPDPRVRVAGGTAELTRLACGPFTVGAEADDGQTRLELNLADAGDAPEGFRQR
jgi:hypothetical protein